MGHEAVLAGAGMATAVAVAAALADRRRTRRSDPDAVGLMPWTAVQALSAIVAIVLAALAIKG